jgi:hypothetical protein
MAQKRTNNPADQKARIAKANEERAGRARAKKEYDAAYRKSTLFRTTVVLRVLVLLFCIYINVLDSVYFGTKAEVITSVENEKVEVVQNVSSKIGLIVASESAILKYAKISTQNDHHYTVDIEEGGTDSSFKAGDTILIQHTVVGKPSYIANAKQARYFPMKELEAFKYTFLFAGMILLISLFMRSGYDLSARLFVWFATAAGLIVFMLYLLI